MRHWTDDELLASIYGVGPSGDHLDACAGCRARLSAMQRSRESVEQSALPADGVSASFLAAQRRAIYQRLERPARPPVRRWAAGFATTVIVAGSFFVYQRQDAARLEQERANDAKLAQEVAMMANDTAAPSMAPLEGLFEQ